MPPIEILISAVLDIVARHYQQTGQIITNDQAYAMVQAEIANGTSAIAQWFRENGLEPPT